MKVTFLPCSNGYGHINRCLLIASFFIKKGWDCEIWCKGDHLKKIKNTLPEISNKEEINCLDLNIPTVNDFEKRNQLSKSFILEAKDKLINSDLIVSDNHIESLLISRNVILSTNFFWHQNYKIMKNNEYKNYCLDIIKKHKPYVIASKLFQNRIEGNQIIYNPIGLIVNCNSLVKKNNYQIKKDSILISAGMTDNSIEIANRVLKELIIKKAHLKHRIFVEPRLLSNNSWPKNIEKATYTQDMYKSLICAFIRPGLGTLINCISNLVCPICFKEDNNLEIMSNIHNITSNKIGLSFKFSIVDEITLKNSEKIFENITSLQKNLDFDGLNQFYGSTLIFKRLFH